MSERRIGVAAEGIADQEVIQAALAAILPEPLVVSPLQPEGLHPSLGLGWCGVARWCIWMRRTGGSLLQGNPTLPDMDLADIERETNAKVRLFNLPLGQRLRKTGIIRQYRDRVVPALTSRWPDVCTICSQAQRFHDDVREAVGR